MGGAACCRWVFWLSTAVGTAVGVGTWLAFRNRLPPVVPWFYSLPWGEQQLRAKEWLLLAPGACVVVAVLIAIVAARMGKDEVLAGLLFAGGVVFQIVMSLALVRVVFTVI